MPWLYFPSVEEYFYGFRADGVVTGFLFLVILATVLSTIKKSQINTVLLSIIGLLGLLLAYITYSKILKMEISRENFTHDNVLVIQALAGTQLGIGVYLSGIAGIGVFLTSIFTLISNKYFKNNVIESAVSKNYLRIAVISLILILVLGFSFYSYNNRPLDENTVRSNITSNLDAMSLALLDGEYEQFVAYNHPVMVLATGGKVKMEQAIKESIVALNRNGLIIKDINLKTVNTIKQDGKKVQAILTQEVIFDMEGAEKSDSQQMLAVSSNNGKSFKFINISGKKKEEITKYFPGVLKDIIF